MNIKYTFLSDIVIISTMNIQSSEYESSTKHGQLNSTWGKIEPKRNCFDINEHNILNNT